MPRKHVDLSNFARPPESDKALADRRIAKSEQCPECDCTSTESNGGTEYRCVACDHRWGIDTGERYGY